MELDSLLKNVRIGKETVLDITGGQDNRKLTVSMRSLLPEEPRAPKRKESPKRAHEFLSARSLADYLAKYGKPGTVVFADPENEVISAALDEGATGGFEVVTMKPAAHPLWKPWAAIAGRAMDVREFASFIAQNRRSVIDPDGRELALTFQQIKGSVSVAIQAGRGKNSINGIVVTTEVKGERQSDLVDLPDTIRLLTPLFVDTGPESVELDLCVEARAEGQILVIVTAGTVLDAKTRAFEQMVEAIRGKTKEIGATLTFGRPKHAAWAYLDEIESDEE